MSTPAGGARQTIVLEIGGQRLRLTVQEPGHVERLAALVNERHATVLKGTRGATPSMLLALVALDLAEELIQARKRADEAQGEARKLVAAAEARAREVEQSARRAVAEAIAELDRALQEDAEHEGASAGETA